MPENTGFLEVRRLSQLGYGDLIRKYLENKALRQGTTEEVQKTATVSLKHPWPQALVSREF